jgi:hypothetical protein
MLAMDYDGNDGKLLKASLDHQVVPITGISLELRFARDVMRRICCTPSSILIALLGRHTAPPTSFFRLKNHR